MGNQKIYEISFVGQDYQPLDDAAKRAIISCEGQEYIIKQNGEIISKSDEIGENRQSDSTMCRKILDALLEDVAPNGRCKNDMIIVNSSEENKKYNENKLYDPNFGTNDKQGYFSGIVGVIRKQIEVSMDGNDTDESKGQNEYVFNVTLQIKSRLDVDNDNNISKPFFLSTMLLRDKVKLSDNTIPNSEDEIFDYLLLFWFKEQLQRACLKGYYKTYRRFEKNNDRVKGSIDVTRHIKLNMGQKNGKIAYSYRENTINNYLNHLIVAAYNHLKNKYYDLVSDNFDNNHDLKKLIEFLSDEIGFSGINKNYLINKNGKTISHPYYTEYEQLRIICLKILRDEGISVFDGDDEQETQGILFYLPDLWELFLEDEVLSKAIPEGVQIEFQHKVMNFGYKQANDEYEYKQKTYPDYVLQIGERPFMVLDAKCKPKWECVFDRESVSEVMEDYNKCLRDMVATNSHATGVIFPTNKDNDINEEILKHRISEYNKTDFFYTIPIQVPKVTEEDTYSDWSGRFKEQLNKRIDIIKKIINVEKEYSNQIEEQCNKMIRKDN